MRLRARRVGPGGGQPRRPRAGDRQPARPPAGAPHVALDYRAPGFPFKPHRELVIRLVAPRVDRVVGTARARSPSSYAGATSGPHLVIAGGVDEAELRPTATRAEMRERLGLAETDFAALILAVLRPEKRVDRFVHAVGLAHAQEPRIRGLVADDGPELPRVEAAARAAGGPSSCSAIATTPPT